MVWLKVWLSLFLLNSSAKEVFSTQPIKLGDTKLKVAIADTVAKRTQGLMFVESWKDYEGMLFIFPTSRERVFWMKNTFLPLSLGFFQKDGRLFEIAKLNPAKSLAQKKVDRVRSSGAALFVLEVPQGWFKKTKSR